jgi:tetratricopeptide (TPR) repeat protein
MDNTFSRRTTHMTPHLAELSSDSTRTNTRLSLETVSVWSLLATLVLALLVFVPSASISLAATKTFVLAFGTLVTVVLYVISRLTLRSVTGPQGIFLYALWLPPVAYALSTAFSGTSFSSAFWGTSLEADTLGFMLIAAVLGTLTALLPWRSLEYRLFLKVGACVFCAVALLALLSIIVGQFVPNIVPPSFSIAGSFADLAFFLGLGVVVLLITLRFFSFARRTRCVLSVGGSVALFLIAVANSYLVWVLLSLTSLGLFVDSVMQRASLVAEPDREEDTIQRRTSLGTSEANQSLFFPLAVLAVSLFFLVGGVFAARGDGAMSISLGDRLAGALHVNSVNLRPLWESTLSTARETYRTGAIFGSGPGTFGGQWLKYRDASVNVTPVWNIDFSAGVGIIPTSFVTVGILGVIAWLLFLGFFFVLGLRMLISRPPQDNSARAVATVSFVGALYLFLVAVFDLPNTVLIAFAFVFVGLFISTMRFSPGREKVITFSSNPRLGFVIAFSLTILLFAVATMTYFLIERFTGQVELASASSAFVNGDLDVADQKVEKSLSFEDVADAYQVQAIIANARISALMASSTIGQSEGAAAVQSAFSQGVSAAVTATKLDPSDYRSWLVLGNLYTQAVALGQSGAYDGAKTAYEKAQMLYPTNPQIPYLMARLDIANKSTKAAETDLQAAIALKQDYAPAYLLLSQLQVADGNVKDALNSAVAAANISPNDAGALFQVGVLYAAQNDLKNAVTAFNLSVSADSQFANARYYLAAAYAKQGDTKNALQQIQALADMSSDNAKLVDAELTALKAGKDPFPANFLLLTSTPAKPTQ